MFQIKVGHLVYDIEFVDPSQIPGEYGHCCPEYQIIRISEGLKPPKMLEIMLHELIHAAWDAADIPSTADEELVCTKLSKVLAGVVLDNGWSVPPLLAWEDEPDFTVEDSELKQVTH